MIRLMDIPAIQRFENHALLTPVLRSDAGAEKSNEFAGLVKSLFGIQPYEFGPQFPDGYDMDEIGDLVPYPARVETDDDTKIIERYERDIELWSQGYDDLKSQPIASIW